LKSAPLLYYSDYSNADCKTRVYSRIMNKHC